MKRGGTNLKFGPPLFLISPICQVSLLQYLRQLQDTLNACFQQRARYGLLGLGPIFLVLLVQPSEMDACACSRCRIEVKVDPDFKITKRLKYDGTKSNNGVVEAK